MKHLRCSDSNQMLSSKVVLASAGTGKTHELTSRVISLLLADTKPGSILATTFTRKAAAEIRHRILARLLSGQSGGLNKASVSKALDILRYPNELSVTTIDGFALRIYQLLEPELSSLGGNVSLDNQLLLQIHEEALEDVIDNCDESQLALLLDSLSSRDHTHTIFHTLSKQAQHNLPSLFSLADNSNAWDGFLPDDERLSETELNRSASLLASLTLPTTAKNTPHTYWKLARDTLQLSISKNDWEGFLSNGLVSSLNQGKESYARTEISAHWKSVLTPLINHAVSECLLAHHRKTLALKELLTKYHASLEQHKAHAGVFTFSDITTHLLKHGAFEHDVMLDLYYRLQQTFDHMLIDEFQDTSVEQFRWLYPLLDELLSGSGSVFLVGDIKQSLYSWRGAEPTLIHSLDSIWPQLQVCRRSKNYRSSPAVLNVVNTVFQSLSTSQSLDRHVADEFTRSFDTHTAHHSHIPGIVRVISDRNTGTKTLESYDDDDTQFTARAELVASRVLKLLADCPRATVGILVRRNSQITPIIAALEKRGVGAAYEGGDVLTECSCVDTAVQALQLAACSDDRVSAYRFRMSPFARVLRTDTCSDDDLATTVLYLVEDIGVGGLLAMFRNACHAEMNQHSLDRFEQAIDLADFIDAQEQSFDLYYYIRTLRSKQIHDPSPRRVTVTTTHKAKGLEYDAVILADLDSRWRYRSGDPVVLRESITSPPHAIGACPNDLVRQIDPRYANAYSEAKSRYLMEELCNLYVAMTRAVHVLEMIVPVPKKTKKGEFSTPLCASTFLCQTLLDEHDRDTLFQSEHGDVVWSSFHGAHESEWATYKRNAVRSDTAQPQDSSERTLIPLEKPSHTPYWRLAHITPSRFNTSMWNDHCAISHPQHMTPLSNPITAPNTASQPSHALTPEAWGIIWHALLERIDWWHPGIGLSVLDSISDAASSIAQNVNAQAKDIVEASRQMMETLDASPHLQQLLTNRNTENTIAVAVDKERTFACTVNLPQRVLVTGRFDRVVTARRADTCTLSHAHIIDYKSGYTSQESRTKSAPSLISQLQLYIRAFAEMHRCDRTVVRGTLAFVDSDTVIDVPQVE